MKILFQGTRLFRICVLFQYFRVDKFYDFSNQLIDMVTENEKRNKSRLDA